MRGPGRIVVVGSLHHDIVVEAPRQPARGETLMGRTWYPKFGGKGGNQAVAAARMGAAVEMVGAVGDDAFGADLRAVLAAEGVGHARVKTAPGGSGMSVAIVDADGDYAAVVVSGTNAALTPEAVADPALWQVTDALILQNEVPEAVNMAAARAARAAGARVIWNAAPWREDVAGLAALADMIVVNTVEAAQMTGREMPDLDAAAEVAYEIALRSADGAMTIVTMGAAGLAMGLASGSRYKMPARPAEGARAHGAGDVFTGALTAALTAGQPPVPCAGIAAEAARRHVSGLSIAEDVPWQ